MATHISGRVTVKVLRRAGDNSDYQPHLELTAQRFMGVLKHPVPRSEMLHKFGLDQRGCKVVAEWHADAPDDQPVKVGDLLEIEGQTHSILGIGSARSCYLELYFEEV